MIGASLALEEFELSVVEIKYFHPFEECIVDGEFSEENIEHYKSQNVVLL